MLDRRLALAPVALLLVHIVGCSSGGAQVSSVFDPLTRFPTAATYAWDESANTLPSDDRLQTLDLDALIKEAANQEFSARGYRPVSTGSPDFKLSYQLVVHTRIDPEHSTSVGTLSLMLVESATNRRVWMGYGRAEVLVGLTREERLARLRKAVAEMLKKFPPTQRGD